MAMARCCAALLVSLMPACAPLPAPSPPSYAPQAQSGMGFQAVLVAGDELPAFDNAVQAMAGKLAAAGTGPAAIQRLSATPAIIAQDGVRTASLDNVLSAIAAMRPQAGQGCLVFATSHGAQFRGLYLKRSGDVLSPDALDRALARGCGDAPTAVIVSGCFTGTFAAPPMARPNRVVLTAARPDRTSFGCDASRTYTVFDGCLLEAAPQAEHWPEFFAAVTACVASAETKARVRPSQPQAWFGPAAAGLPVPLR